MSKPRYVSPAKRLRPSMTRLERFRRLLELDRATLALIMDIPTYRVDDACKRDGMAISSDEAYTKLLEYCNMKIGLVYAVKKDLEERLEADRKARLLNRERIKGNEQATTD